MKDDQGREYRLEALPKAHAVKQPDGSLRTVWGIPVDLGREDAEFFYIKVYRVGPPPAAPTAPPRTSATAATTPLPAEIARIVFDDWSEGLPSAGQWREGVAVADLTGDGRLDIVAGPARKTLRAPSVFTRGAAGWTRATVTMPAVPYDYGDLSVAPATQGQPALVVLGVHLKGLIALEQQGPTSFADASVGLPRASRGDESVFSSRSVLTLDCNGDGRTEIVALGEGPRLGASRGSPGEGLGLAVFSRAATGRWAMQRADVTRGLHGGGLTVGDIDGDRHLDLALAPAQLGQREVVLRGDGACGWTPERVDALWPRAYVTAVALGDLDGDGRAELVAGTTRFEETAVWGHLDVYSRSATGAWTRGAALARVEGRARFEGVAIVDLDGDGRVDVAALGPEGQVLAFLGDGKGGFVRNTTSAPAPGRCAASALTTGDLDGDGRPDLVVTYAQERSGGQDPAECPSEGAIRVWRTAGTPAALRTPARD